MSPMSRSASLPDVMAFSPTSYSPGANRRRRGLAATASQEGVVPGSEYRALQNQVKELQRLLGKRAMGGEILKEAFEIASVSKRHLLRSFSLPKDGSR